MALEIAIDELAEKVGMDPIERRILNDTQVDPENPQRPFSQRQLIQCLRLGADRFGWSGRNATPRSGPRRAWLVGLGMAAAIRSNHLLPFRRTRARLDRAGRGDGGADMTDIGTGSYTIIAQTAAEMMGLPLDKVVVRTRRLELPRIGRVRRPVRRQLCDLGGLRRLRQAARGRGAEARLRHG